MEDITLSGSKRRRHKSTESKGSTPPKKQKTTSSKPNKKYNPKRTTEEDCNMSESNNANNNATPPPPTDPRQLAFQGLLNQFGSGLDDFIQAVPSLSGRLGARNQVRTFIDGLQNEDESMQMQTLLDLCDFLSMSSEDSLGGLAADQLVPPLVYLLNYEHNPDIMLLATRALTYLIEPSPKAAKAIVDNGAIPIFCSKLLIIQYIDVAEQTLQILEKLSSEHSVALLQAGGLMAVLTYLDFFSTITQRSCVVTAANLCKLVPPGCFEFVSSVLPILTSLLLNRDPKIVSSAILCFQRLTKCFRSNKENIEIIANQGLVEHLVRLLTGASPAGTIDQPGRILNILEVISKQSPIAIVGMLQEGMAPVLKNLLVSEEQSTHTPTPSTKHLQDVLSLVNQFLPSLPEHASPIHVQRDKYVVPSSSSDATTTTTATSSSVHTTIYNENLPLFLSLSQCMYGPVKNVFNNNINPTLRLLSLKIVMKVIYLTPEQDLIPILRDMETSTFVASLLGSNRLAYVGTALRLANIMMQKLPDIFSKYFRREGVIFQIDRLAASSYIEPSTSDDSNTREMKQWIHTQALSFRNTYFKPEGETDGTDDALPVFATEEMKTLRKLTRRLNKEANSSDVKTILYDISQMMVANGGVSAFEFERSDAISALLNFLADETVSEEELSLRWEWFSDAFERDNLSPLKALVQLLQTALIQNEKFTILLNDIKGSGSGLKFLTQPLKIRLAKDESASANLQSFTSNLITIEPLASIAAVEDFLWRKVQPREPAPRTASLASKFAPRGRASRGRGRREARRTSSSSGDDLVDSNESVESGEEFDEFSDQYDDQDDPDEGFGGESESVCEINVSPTTSSATNARARSTSSNSTANTPKKQRHLSLYLEGRLLSYQNSVFQELQTAFNESSSARNTENTFTNEAPAQRIWTNEYVITYKEADSSNSKESENAVAHTPQILPSNIPAVRLLKKHSAVEIPENTGISTVLRDILRLLDVLYLFSSYWQPKSAEIQEYRNSQKLDNNNNNNSNNVDYFMNGKLASKLVRQLQDALTVCSGVLPPWCGFLIKHYQFLFPFECRKQYFTSTSLGIARALHCLQQLTPVSEPGSETFRVGRIQRQKVRVSRKQILECAFKVMEMYSKSKAVLEVEFFGEVGTGSGPTLEFFTIIAHQLQRKDLLMWNHPGGVKKTYEIPAEDFASSVDERANTPFEYIFTTGGLYPVAMRSTDEHYDSVIHLFQFFGCFMAKAILDERLLDISLAAPFFKWLTSDAFSLEDVAIINPSVGSALRDFSEIATRYAAFKAELGDATPSAEQLAQFDYQKGGIEQLSLTFTLPNRNDWELKENGADIDVTLENVAEYVELVTRHLLIDGVREQMTAFIRGFEQVLPLSSLNNFRLSELDTLVCGWSNSLEHWDQHSILESITCDHHYSLDSLPVQFFTKALTDFSVEDKKNFLLFVTGSPKLPVGGFKNLKPKLTVVRKEISGNADDFLPSVMTCMNYVKLPAYSSYEITKQRLLFAVREGLSSFHFS